MCLAILPNQSTISGAKALYIHMKHLLIIAAMVSTAVYAQVPVHVSADHSVRTHLPRVPKGKILRSNPYRFTAIRLQGTDPYDAPDDDYISTSGIRRPKITKPKLEDDDLSSYVQVRLAVARARAMQKYRQVHT